MAKQLNIPNELLDYEKKILELEKKYTDLLAEFIDSIFFKNQLKKIFIELNNETEQLLAYYDGANLINTPAERLVSYCMYYEFLRRKNEGIAEFQTVECYSYPICGDLAIELSEVVLDLEVKTVSKNGNASDITSLQFRPNQTSFTNIIPYEKANDCLGFIPKFKIQGHIPQYHRDKPVLTYVIEIIYDYDASDPSLPFGFFTGTYHDCTALNLFCVPNGQIARLFDNNIFQGIKTYTYYDQTKIDDVYYKKIKLDVKKFPTRDACLIDINNTYSYLLNECDERINSNWKIANNNNYIVLIDTSKIGPGAHEKRGILWTLTTIKNNQNNVQEPYLRAIKSPGSCRIDWQTNLVDRYDIQGNHWNGVRHIYI